VTPKQAYTQAEAAEALSVSRAWFRQSILPELRVVRRGRRTLIPVKEIDRWLDAEAKGL
jgi:hypothetical protein